MVNIGGATTSLAVFEEGELIHASILPVGADHITNDIAIGLRTSIDIAEKVKLEYGSSISHNIGKREEIDLSKIDSRDSGVVLRHHVVEIIEARMEEIFGMVERDLKKIGRSGLLPAGVVITGGGAKMPEIVELAKSLLKLPVQVGFPVNLGGIMDKVDDPSFATVIGLILWEKDKRESPVGHPESPKVIDKISHKAGGFMKLIKKLMERFLP